MADVKRDYYELLGVARSADEKAIKDAFRAAARKWHPDRNKSPEAVERFKEISEAYGVLSDADKRRRYDRGGHAAVDGGGFSGDVDLGDLFGFGGGSIFDTLFGGGGRRRQQRHSGPRPGRNATIEVAVSLERIAEGGEEELRLSRRVECMACGGDGATPGTERRRCSGCRGTGQRVVERREGPMLFRQVVGCPTCQGAGTIVESPCERCDGAGRVAEEEVLRLKIPAGIPDGMALRVPGRGEESEDPGGIPGDLHVVVHGRDPRFERRGAHLVTTEAVSIVDLALGVSLNVATPTGSVRVHVPAGTQHGATLKVRGAGLPEFREAGRGDLYVGVEARVPVDVSPAERELYERLRELEQARLAEQEDDEDDD